MQLCVAKHHTQNRLIFTVRLLGTRDTSPRLQRNHFPIAEHKSHRSIFLSAVLTAAHIFPSFTGPSSRRGQFNRRAGGSQTLFDKYYLLAGRGGVAVNLPPRNVSLHRRQRTLIEELVNRICRRPPGDTTLNVFRGHGRKLTVHELNRQIS